MELLASPGRGADESPYRPDVNTPGKGGKVASASVPGAPPPPKVASETARPRARDIKARVNARSLPGYCPLLPRSAELQRLSGPLKDSPILNGILWKPRDWDVTPKTPDDWIAHPFAMEDMPASCMAGATAGDEEESQICLHFVFCKPLAGVALSNATLGPITRDKRWGRHLGDVLEKKDLEAMGLHEPRELAPLEQATERPQSQERRSVPSISASREKDDDEDK